MSFWNTVSNFVKKVLYRDDDYSLCRYYLEDCEHCPKRLKCKKASIAIAEYFSTPSVSTQLLSSKNKGEKFSFTYDDHVLVLKFGNAYLEMCADGNIKLKGLNVMVDGNLSTSTGASGAITLLSVAIVQNGIVKGIVGPGGK